MTFPCVRDEISKSILPTGPAHPRHPWGSGKSRSPQDGWGAVRSLPPARRRASLCKGHGAISCPHLRLHVRLDQAGPGWTRHTAHAQPCRRGCWHPPAAAGTVGLPALHVGKPSTEVTATLASQAAPASAPRAGACVQDTFHPFSGVASCPGPGLHQGHRSKSRTVLPPRVTGPRTGGAVSAGRVGAGGGRADPPGRARVSRGKAAALQAGGSSREPTPLASARPPFQTHLLICCQPSFPALE